MSGGRVSDQRILETFRRIEEELGGKGVAPRQEALEKTAECLGIEVERARDAVRSDEIGMFG